MVTSGIWPVTCGDLEGEMTLCDFGPGGRSRCIKFNGDVISLTQFESKAGKSNSHNWKRTIKYKGRPLHYFIEDGTLKICSKVCCCPLCQDVRVGGSKTSGSDSRSGSPTTGAQLEEEEMPLNKAKPLVGRQMRQLLKQDCDSDSGISVSSCTKLLKIEVDVGEGLVNLSPQENDDYVTMIQEAILALAEVKNEDNSKGVSHMNVLLYILKNFKVGDNITVVNTKVKNGLKFLSRMGVIDKLSVDGSPCTDDSDEEEEKKEIKKEDEGKDENKKQTKDTKSTKEKTQTETAKKKKKSTEGPVIKKKKVLTDKLNVDEKKKKITKDKPDNKEQFMSRPKKLTPALATLCGGVKKLSRQDVVKGVWHYVKSNSLQDPAHKSFINCDDKLKTITKKKRIDQTELLGYITKHLSD